jgi:hypothetical protein
MTFHFQLTSNMTCSSEKPKEQSGNIFAVCNWKGQKCTGDNPGKGKMYMNTWTSRRMSFLRLDFHKMSARHSLNVE